jgi:hypothetical protein
MRPALIHGIMCSCLAEQAKGAISSQTPVAGAAWPLQETDVTTMTPEQAYAAMFYFLEDYYGRGHSDEIGGMIGGMSLLSDGGTSDPAVASGWQRAVQRAMTEGNAGLAFRIVKKQ